MLTWAIPAAVALLGLALLPALWRALAGPTICDRILALDTLSLNVAGLLVVLGMVTASSHFFEAALLIAALGCIGTVALARYAERGRLTD